MDQTHVHLIVSHLPIFGSILGVFVLAHGLWAKSDSTQIASFTLFIISSLGAAVAYLTGEAAEETAENIRGVAEVTIERHEEFALIALIGLTTLGVVSLFGMFLSWKKPSLSRQVAFVILIIALVSFGLAARTGYLGGQIRHTEVYSPTGQNQGVESSEEGS